MSKQNQTHIIPRLLPLMAVCALLPLVVFYVEEPAGRSALTLLSNSSDLFGMAKARLLIFLGPLALLCSAFSPPACQHFSRLKKDPSALALLPYFLLVILSAIFSAYPDAAIFGVGTTREGLLVHLSYACLWLAVYLQVSLERQVQFIIYSLYFFVLVSVPLGFSQLLGHDLLMNESVLRLFVPAEYIQSVDRTFTVDYLTLTLGNSNYTGSLMCMLFTIALSQFIIADKPKPRLIHGVFVLLSFFLLLGSFSRAGYVAAACGMLFITVMYRKLILARWKPALALMCLLALTFCAIDLQRDGGLTSRFLSLFSASSYGQNETVMTLPQQLPDENTYVQNEHIFTLGDGTLSYRSNASAPGLHIELADGEPLCYDDNGVLVTLKKAPEQSKSEQNKYDVIDSRFPISVYVQLSAVSIQHNEDKLFVHTWLQKGRSTFITYDGKPIDAAILNKQATPRAIGYFEIEGDKIIISSGNLRFTIEGNGDDIRFYDDQGPIEYMNIFGSQLFSFTSEGYEGFNIVNEGNHTHIFRATPYINFSFQDGAYKVALSRDRLSDIGDPPIFAPLQGHESLFTGRGYIWGRAIPLLKDTVFLGRGPDNFMFYFPQDDFNQRLKYCGNPFLFYDKPHMMYLQTAINSGIISLLCILAAFVLYFIKVGKLYAAKGADNTWVRYGICFSGAILAYLVAGIINDSVVRVAPVFWLLFGMACAINRNCAQEAEAVAQRKAKTKRR